MVPVGTPQAVVDKLNADIGRVLQSNEIKTKLQEQGAIVVGGTSDEFGGFLKNELTKWKRVAGAAKIRLD
jgi:tripartite-type tricarboxylate transporter receptor subunit TctC